MFLSIRQSLIHQLLGFNYRTLDILFGDKGIQLLISRQTVTLIRSMLRVFIIYGKNCMQNRVLNIRIMS